MKNVIISLLLFAFLGGCKANESVRISDVPEHPIVIVFENDVHCAVDGYAKLAGLREEQRRRTSYITTVSCGDFVQGDVVGSVSRGENIVEFMTHVDESSSVLFSSIHNITN